MKNSFKKVVRKTAQLALIGSLFLGLGSCTLKKNDQDKYEQAQVELETKLQEADLESYLTDEISKENRVAFNNALNSLHKRAEELYSEGLITQEKLDAFKLTLDNRENFFITYNLQKALDNSFNKDLLSYTLTTEGSFLSDEAVLFNSSELFRKYDNSNAIMHIDNEDVEVYYSNSTGTTLAYEKENLTDNSYPKQYLDGVYEELVYQINRLSLSLSDAESIEYIESNDSYILTGKNPNNYTTYIFNGDMLFQYINSNPDSVYSEYGNTTVATLNELTEEQYNIKREIFANFFDEMARAYKNQEDELEKE